MGVYNPQSAKVIVWYSPGMTTKQRNEDIRKFHKQGASPRELADHFDLAASRIYQILRGEEYMKTLGRQWVEKKRELRVAYRASNPYKGSCTVCGAPYQSELRTTRCDKHRGAGYITKEPQTFSRTCPCGVTFETHRSNAVYCPTHHLRTRNATGRDRNRDYVRILRHDTCEDCGRVWSEEERKFDIHHNKECGGKSRGYDLLEDVSALSVLCHRCHMANHASKKIALGVRKMTTDKREAVCILSKAGWTQDRIAKTLSMTQPTVWRTLSEAA